jgi:SPX domain protein involved in polyphosphate accumulation
MGKSAKLDKKKKKGAFVRQRLAEKDSIEEQQRKQMIKMVEDILTKKSKDDSDVVRKEESVSKILKNNLKAIKKLAEREGINLTQLIKILKSGE